MNYTKDGNFDPSSYKIVPLIIQHNVGQICSVKTVIFSCIVKIFPISIKIRYDYMIEIIR